MSSMITRRLVILQNARWKGLAPSRVGSARKISSFLSIDQNLQSQGGSAAAVELPFTRLMLPNDSSGFRTVRRHFLTNQPRKDPQLSGSSTLDTGDAINLENGEDSSNAEKEVPQRKHAKKIPPDPNSKRSQFRTIPVHTQILDRIRSMGLGIRKRETKKRKKRRNKDPIMSLEDEKDYFNERSDTKLRRSKKKKDSKGTSTDTETLKSNTKNDSSSESTSDSPSTDDFLASSPWLPPPPFTMSSKMKNEYTPTGLLIRRRPVKILGAVGDRSETFPRESKGLPEIALAGRSNVGKSTLLNALLYGNTPKLETGDPFIKQRRGNSIFDGAKLPKGKKAVVSSKPGETRQITFYQLSSDLYTPDETEKVLRLGLLLVDLPGYGFAYAKEGVMAEWQELMRHYLLHRRSSALKRILLLIDARHGMKKADADFLDNLQTIHHSTFGLKKDLPPIQIVLTKCDLVSEIDLARRVVQVREQLSDKLRREPLTLEVMLVSAKPGVGFNNVRGEKARGGVLELQRELAGLVVRQKQQTDEGDKSLLSDVGKDEDSV